MQHFLSLADCDSQHLQRLLDLAAKVKADPQTYRTACEGKALGMLFQKPSTRTRVSFEVGISQLGGSGLFLSSRDIQLGRGETIADTARVLSRYLDILMARVYAQDDIVILADAAEVPVINGLSDLLHPCQGLADFFTLLERCGRLGGAKLAYVGDGNNVAHSLILGGPLFGVDVSVATPLGCEPDPEVVERANRLASAAATRLEVLVDPKVAVAGADAVYTDTWISMGQEEERAEKVARFAGFQVDAELMSQAKSGACFMHCLPAHRNEEVTDEVLDAPYSAILDQAENRLHVQKALMLWLLDAV